MIAVLPFGCQTIYLKGETQATYDPALSSYQCLQLYNLVAKLYFLMGRNFSDPLYSYP
jgi:hypothetical protein